MKTINRILTILLVLVMTVSLFGCGDKEASENRESQSGNSGISGEKPTASGTYQDGAMFQFGLAPANTMATSLSGGYYGYINIKGEWVIDPIFTSARSFCANGYAFVSTQVSLPDDVLTVWHCIDLQGQFVSEYTFLSASHFPECGIARVNVNDEEGNERQAFFYKGDNGFELRYVDSLGEGMGSFGFSDEGYATVILPDGGSGLINTSFEWVIAPSATLELNRYGINNGLIAAEDTATGTCGFMDATGNWVYTLENSRSGFWLDAIYADNGLVCIERDRTVRDKSGNVVINLREIEGELLYDFTDSELLCFQEEGMSDAYDRFVYYDAAGNYIAGNSRYNERKWIGNVPLMTADRILICEHVFRDDTGKATGIDWEGTQNTDTPVVINSKREFIYAVHDVISGDLANYYTDGYTWGTYFDEFGNELCVILDTEGNIIFQATAENPILTIVSDYKGE